jgi:hypothetical protein
MLGKLYIIVISLTAGCVTFNYQPKSPDSSSVEKNTAAEVVLIQEVEMLPLKPGETFTVPTDVPGVKHWYLISDFALIKVNNIQIDHARFEQQ